MKKEEIKEMIEKAINEAIDNYDSKLSKITIEHTHIFDDAFVKEIDNLRGDIKALRDTLSNAIQEWRPVSLSKGAPS